MCSEEGRREGWTGQLRRSPVELAPLQDEQPRQPAAGALGSDSQNQTSSQQRPERQQRRREGEEEMVEGEVESGEGGLLRSRVRSSPSSPDPTQGESPTLISAEDHKGRIERFIGLQSLHICKLSGPNCGFWCRAESTRVGRACVELTILPTAPPSPPGPSLPFSVSSFSRPHLSLEGQAQTPLSPSLYRLLFVGCRSCLTTGPRRSRRRSATRQRRSSRRPSTRATHPHSS